jgi:hypothetical protein
MRSVWEFDVQSACSRSRSQAHAAAQAEQSALHEMRTPPEEPAIPDQRVRTRVPIIVGIRILSGGGFHNWIDEDTAKRRGTIEVTGLFGTSNYIPMVCLNCGTEAFRERGTGKLQLLAVDEEDVVNPTLYLRGLKDPEKHCEFMIVKKIMVT